MSDFHSVQNFLDRCHKRRYVPFAMNTVRDLVYRQDKKLLNMTNKALEQPPLNESLPEQNHYNHNVGRKRCFYPKINPERFKNTFVNRLIFKYNIL